MASRCELISTIKHPAVAAARESLGQVGGKSATAFPVDGRRLVAQAVACGASVERVFFVDPVEAPEQLELMAAVRQAGIEHYAVTKGVFFRILGLGYETSVRVLATVTAQPAPLGQIEALATDQACILIGERIQDPRNIGVLIRTADAMGLAAAVFSSDSANPFSRECVRSSTGSIFRVPLGLAGDLAPFIARLQQNSVRVIGTSAHAPQACWDADLLKPCAILLGNETSGLSGAAAAACDALVAVPMFGGAHSLNVTVAGGILMCEMNRQNRRPGAPPL